MRNRDMEQIGRTWVAQNIKRHKLKGCGLFNFDPSFNPAGKLSEQIRRDIFRNAGKKSRDVIKLSDDFS